MGFLKYSSLIYNLSKFYNRYLGRDQVLLRQSIRQVVKRPGIKVGMKLSYVAGELSLLKTIKNSKISVTKADKFGLISSVNFSKQFLINSVYLLFYRGLNCLVNNNSSTLKYVKYLLN